MYLGSADFSHKKELAWLKQRKESAGRRVCCDKRVDTKTRPFTTVSAAFGGLACRVLRARTGAGDWVFFPATPCRDAALNSLTGSRSSGKLSARYMRAPTLSRQLFVWDWHPALFPVMGQTLSRSCDKPVVGGAKWERLKNRSALGILWPNCPVRFGFGGTMQEQEYETLVWSLQSEAQEVPGVFRLKVMLISVLAYVALVCLLLVLLIGLFAMLVAMHGNSNPIYKYFFVSWVLAVAPVVWLTFRMFLAPIRAPAGRELHGNEAPQLFKMIADLQERLQGAPIHHVLVTNEFNAALAQCPRFGLFGRYRNYLVLGLPLLYAVSPAEILAVMAHEYGHLSRSHGKLGGWVYRQRVTFDALYKRACERRESNVVNEVLARLLDRFTPYYNAYTFVLSRQNEYEADAISREIAGAEASASALIRINLLESWLEKNFWPKLYAQSAHYEMPPVMPYVAMRKLLVMTMDEWATADRLNELLKAESGVHDTHPCLNERLAALDQHGALPPIPSACAADALLGKTSHTLAAEFDTGWWGEEKDKWQKQYRRYTLCTTRIAELEKRPVASLSAPEAQELALLLFEFRSASAAKQVLEDLLGRSGERYPKPVYLYGRALLEGGEQRGLDYLEEACRLSPAMEEDCVRVGYQWLVDRQNEVAAQKWLERIRTAHAPAPSPALAPAPSTTPEPSPTPPPAPTQAA